MCSDRFIIKKGQNIQSIEHKSNQGDHEPNTPGKIWCAIGKNELVWDIACLDIDTKK